MSAFKRSTKITTASAAASPMSSPRNSTSGDRPARMAQLQQIRDEMMTIDMHKSICVCPSQPFGLSPRMLFKSSTSSNPPATLPCDPYLEL
ncbi:hypothetical protein BGZ93_000903 [Podila epicladia]|nr:hypothetical protein BGZ93_000903 [Podila epicladia]KAG0085576.1 hypothetical protein BGZ92_008881 [Podila epicladia]